MEPTAESDDELVANVLAGDREAFGELYDRHARGVRSVVLAVSCDWSAVDDMTQECFLRAYRKLSTLRDRGQFGAWMAGFARQVARERRRALRRDRHEFCATVIGTVTAHDGSTDACDRERIDRLMRRLVEIPEKERIAVHMFYFEQQNADRAAKRMELSRSGFYALLQRALAKLATSPKPAETVHKATKP